MLTHGGLPENQALHSVEQAIGEVVYLLYSGSFEKRKQGYIKFYEAKRHFLLTEWFEQMDRLEAYRKENGATPIYVMLEEVRQTLIKQGIQPAIQMEPDLEPEVLPIVHLSQKEPEMGGLKMLCAGLVMIGQAFIEFSKELEGAAGKAVSLEGKAVSMEKTPPAKVALDIVQDTKPATVTPDKPAEIDFAALRATCIEKAMKLAAKDRNILKSVVDKFGRASVAPDAMLIDLSNALDAALV